MKAAVPAAGGAARLLSASSASQKTAFRAIGPLSPSAVTRLTRNTAPKDPVPSRSMGTNCSGVQRNRARVLARMDCLRESRCELDKMNYRPKIQQIEIERIQSEPQLGVVQEALAARAKGEQVQEDYEQAVEEGAFEANLKKNSTTKIKIGLRNHRREGLDISKIVYPSSGAGNKALIGCQNVFSGF